MTRVIEKRRLRSQPSKKKGKSAVIDAPPVSDPHVKEFVDKTYTENKQIFDKLAKL